MQLRYFGIFFCRISTLELPVSDPSKLKTAISITGLFLLENQGLTEKAMGTRLLKLRLNCFFFNTKISFFVFNVFI